MYNMTNKSNEKFIVSVGTHSWNNMLINRALTQSQISSCDVKNHSLYTLFQYLAVCILKDGLRLLINRIGAMHCGRAHDVNLLHQSRARKCRRESQTCRQRCECFVLYVLIRRHALTGINRKKQMILSIDMH